MRNPTPAKLRVLIGVVPALLCCVALADAPDAATTKPDLNYKPGVDKVMELLKSADSQPSAMRILRGFPEEAIAVATDDLAGEFKGLPDDLRAKVSQVLQRNHSARMHAKASADAAKAWNETTLADDYKSVGKHDPAWDADAINAMISFTREAADLTLFQKAHDEGCTDLLFRYFWCRALRNAGTGRYGKRMDTIADAMVASDYPASRKSFALLNAVKEDFPAATSKVALTDDQAKQIKTRLDTALKLFPDACKETGFPSSLMRELADLLQAGYYRSLGDRQKAFDIVYPVVSASLGNTNLPREFKARFYVDFAWDARGGGVASTVTPQGWDQMAERLKVARAELTQASNQDDYDVAAPNQMLEVILGDESGPGEIDTWFTKAVEADPDFRAPYTKKMYYLEPKWHGSPQEMLAFGRECSATQNFAAGIPLELVRAHETLSTYLDGGSTGSLHRQYFANNAAAWDDIRSAMVPTLSLKPDDYHDRSLFARDAVWCGQLAEAKRQFQLLGDHADLQAFGTQLQLTKLRNEANAAAGSNSPENHD